MSYSDSESDPEIAAAYQRFLQYKAEREARAAAGEPIVSPEQEAAEFEYSVKLNKLIGQVPDGISFSDKMLLLDAMGLGPYPQIDEPVFPEDII